jgi:hypothetical protein
LFVKLDHVMPGGKPVLGNVASIEQIKNAFLAFFFGLFEQSLLVFD